MSARARKLGLSSNQVEVIFEPLETGFYHVACPEDKSVRAPFRRPDQLGVKMALIVVDVESDGPIPHKYSMVCFGAVVVEPNLSKTFYGKTKPISDDFLPEALAISCFSREEHLCFDEPKDVMMRFYDWIKANSNGAVFISDNLAFDWQWINYYFHYFIGKNPFGFSGRRIGDLYAGLKKDYYAASKWKKFRKTIHTRSG